MIEAAMAGSTRREEIVTRFSAASASVNECASVNPVMTSSSGLSRWQPSSSAVRNSRWSKASTFKICPMPSRKNSPKLGWVFTSATVEAGFSIGGFVVKTGATVATEICGNNFSGSAKSAASLPGARMALARMLPFSSVNTSGAAWGGRRAGRNWDCSRSVFVGASAYSK
jgi:hypothetical protein